MFNATLTAAEFADLASASVFTGDKARPILTGVFLEVEGNTITATATDSYRLVVITRELEKDNATGAALIPAEVLERAAKDARKTKDNVTVIVDDLGAFTISNARDEWRYGGRVIEGKYPEVKSLIPTGGTINELAGGISLNPWLMADIVKLAPWCNVKGRERGVSPMKISAITDARRPIRVESRDGLTVVVQMPIVY